MTVPASGLWPGLFAIIDRHGTTSALEYHGLSAVAAAHWTEIGRPVPPEVRARSAGQVAAQLAAERLVRAMRAASDGPILLLKGLDVAARYPEPSWRRVRDVDGVVPEAERAHELLVARGFARIVGHGVSTHPDAFTDLHELAPLAFPGITMRLEVHRRVNWPSWGTAPALDEILEAAVPSVVGVEGVLAPAPEHHALIVLAHSWSRQTFGQLSQLVDFALLMDDSDLDEVRRVAERWGTTGLFDVARRTVDSVLLRIGPDPRVVRWCAPHLRTLAIPSSRRRQLQRYAATYFVIPPAQATRSLCEGIGRRAQLRLRRARRAQP